MRLDRSLALAALFAGLVAAVIAAGLVAVQGGFGSTPGYFLVAAAALLVTSAILEPSALLALGRTRRGRSGVYSVGFSVVVLAALAFVNVFASKGVQHLDLSATQQNTLEPKTVTVLHQLRSDLGITAFYSQSDPDRSTVQNLLGQYRAASPHVKVAFVDPNADPASARALGVESEGSIALTYQDRKPVVLGAGSNTEQDVTGAILKLELNRTLTLCWAVGDGERDLESSDPALGYSTAAGALAGDAFSARQLDLSLAASIPGDCDLVAVVGPHTPPTAAGIKALQAYLGGGGRLLVATDPWRDDVNASLNQVVQAAGLKFDGGLIVEDAAHSYQNAAIPLVVDYGGQSPIARSLQNQASVFPAATGVTSGGDPSFTTAPVASTSAGSYEAPAQRQDLSRQAGDKPGPFDIMVTADKTLASGRERLVAVGSSAFAENQVVPPRLGSVNLQLFLGSLDWLAGEDALISLPPKPSGPLPLTLTSGEIGLDFFIAELLLPLLIAFAGFLVWWRRRRVTSPQPAA